MPSDYPPFDPGLAPGDADEYLLTSGAYQWQRGFFTRDQSGAVIGLDLAGRLYTRVGDAQSRPARLITRLPRASPTAPAAGHGPSRAAT